MRLKFSLLLFSLSAAAGLIYQIVWVRQATLVFGVSIYAYSAVLAAYMGGNAFGAFVLRRWSPQRSPLRLYAGLQIGIAILGVLAFFALTALQPLYTNLAQGVTSGSSLLTWTRLGFSILVLVPPTFLMGGTLPIVARLFATRAGTVGSDLGRLYMVDTLGAAIGCGLSGLWLLAFLGAQSTVYVAVSLNLICALGAWLLGEEVSRREEEGKRIGEERPEPNQSKIQNPKSKILLAAYGISGFVALGYEIIWARILAIFTLNAVYSFTIMLTTFLLGLSLGGWLAARWSRRKLITLADFGLVQLAIGLAALLTLGIFALMPHLTLESFFAKYSVAAEITYEFILGVMALSLPTTLLGFVFPLIASLITHEQTEEAASRIGLATALNTSGAIAGSLLVSYFLIPLVGLKGSVITLAAINLLIGTLAHWGDSWEDNYWSTEPRAARVTKPAKAKANPTYMIWWIRPAAACLIAGLFLALLPSGYYLGFRADPGENMVYYGEGVETTVAVFDIPEQNFKASFVNGRMEVPTDRVSMLAFRILGHLPPLLKPDAQNALMLSFGNGVATGSLDLHRIPRIDAVDLSEQQFEAARFYWQENHNVLHSPRLFTHIEDGRNFLLQTSQHYDIITTDATHPSNTSSWALFTEEFYRSVANRLTPEGVFMQWSPFHSLLEEDYKRILRTFQQVFPHATLWYVGSSHTLLLATPERLDEAMLTRLLAKIDQDKSIRVDLESAAQVRGYWIMDEDQLRTYTGTGRLSTDDNAFFLPDNDDTAGILAEMAGFVGQ